MPKSHRDRYRKFQCGHWRANNTLPRGGCVTCKRRRDAACRARHATGVWPTCGHERSPANTANAGQPGRRPVCRTCRNARARRNYAKRRGNPVPPPLPVLTPAKPASRRAVVLDIAPLPPRPEIDCGRSYTFAPRRSA